MEVIMCSTPRPKGQVKGKSGSSGSILSNVSAEARRSFAQRANIADERRYHLAMEKEQQSRQLHTSQKNTKKHVSQKNTKLNRNFSYWLVSASLKEIFLVLFFGKSKSV